MKNKWFKKISDLGVGSSFGELALINSAPRAATIKCTDTCFFAVINRDDYTKTLKRLELKEQNKKISFFKSIPFFKHLTSN